MDYSFLSAYSGWAFATLRVVVGVIFLAHGWPKLKNLKQTQEWFGSIGFKPGVFWGTFVALLETFGATALILGLFVQPLAALFVVLMLGAGFWKMKQGQKLSGGYELDLVLLAACLLLMTS